MISVPRVDGEPIPASDHNDLRTDIINAGTNLGDGTSSAPGLAFASQPTLGLWRIGSDNAGFSGSLAIKGPRPWIDVRAYGATGDGTTDDGATIANVAAAASGASVFFPAGTYLCDQFIDWPANVQIVGAGIGVTTIKHGPNVPTSKFWRFHDHSIVSDLTVDGNASGDTDFAYAELGQVLPGGGVIFQRVEVINFNDLGIDLTNSSGDTGQPNIAANCIITGALSAAVSNQIGIETFNATNNASRSIITGCTITKCGTNAIIVDGVSLVTGNYISNNVITGWPGGQIAVWTNQVKSVLIENNYIGPPNDSSTGSGCEINGYTDVRNNTIIGCRYGVILQFNSQMNVTGNTIKNCTLDAIRVNANITDFTVQGNRCYDDQGSPTQDWGLNILAGTSDRYIVMGNDFTGNVNAAGLTDNGTGTNKQVIGNLPLVAEQWIPFTGIAFDQNGAVATTINYARYRIVGKIAHVEIRIVATAVGTITQAVAITGWPAVIAPKQNGTTSYNSIGHGSFLFGANFYSVEAIAYSSSVLRFFTGGVGNFMGITPNQALAVNDRAQLSMTYEIA